MKTSRSTQMMSVSALLIAIGILIPMVMPVKVVIPPASFTLASHVPIFIAMMISPGVALAVSIGTTIGFFLGGFPIVIVLRAASHFVFSVLGALYLKKYPTLLDQGVRVRVFSFVVGVIHSLCEVFVVSSFYFGGQMTEAYYQSGFLRSVLLLVGVGGVIHSMVDFEISYMITKVLRKQRGISALFLTQTRQNNTEVGF